MSRRRRGRITVQHQPTGPARVMYRMMGVIHAVVGTVFAGMALTLIIPNAGLIGIPFLLVGGFFAVNGVLIALGRNGFAHRVGYDIETDVQEDTIYGLLEEPPAEFTPGDQGNETPAFDPNARQRLEQLEELKGAGLITEAEYREKRAEILKEL